MSFTAEKVFTVTAITRLIKHTLEESFGSVWVEGEISNYLHHSSGHRYLNLKDDKATIKLTIWRSLGQYLKFEPENGMKVRAFGDINVYEKGGNYQLNVKKLTPLGIGELEIAFRQMYEKLASEGLFDQSAKQAIPEYPTNIGVVTSPTGAAVRDIINVARRRNDAVRLVIHPAQVQGKGAEETIIRGIEYFNNRDDIDCVIIARGGGSLEDLWCFNEESLVRVIADCQKPIISGVGHEIDTTLADLAADLRAPTPSAAAEMAIWDKQEFIDQISGYFSHYNYLLENTISIKRNQLANQFNRPVYRAPESMIQNRQQYLDGLSRLIDSSGKNLLELHKNRLSLFESKLSSLSPMAVIKRGYAVIKNRDDGRIIKSVDEIRAGQTVETLVSDGSYLSKIERVSKDDREEKEI